MLGVVMVNIVMLSAILLRDVTPVIETDLFALLQHPEYIFSITTVSIMDTLPD